MQSPKKIFLAFCALIFGTSALQAMGEVVTRVLEVFNIIVEASALIISMTVAVQHGQRDIPSALLHELHHDKIMQQIVQDQKSEPTLARANTGKKIDIVRTVAAAQQKLVQTIPSETLAEIVIPVDQAIVTKNSATDTTIAQENRAALKIDKNALVGKTIAQHEAFIEAQCKESNKWYESFKIPGGTRIEGIDKSWYAQATVGPRVDRTPSLVQLNEYRLFCKNVFSFALNNPTYAQYIKNTIYHIESLLHLVNSDDLSTRIYARLALAEIRIEGPIVEIDGRLVQTPVPFDEAFQYLVIETGKRWYSKEGQLISAEKISNLHAFSTPFISKAMHHVPELRGRLRYVENLDAVPKESGWKSFKQLWRKSHHQRVTHNEANDVVKQLIRACHEIDIDKAQPLYEKYMQGMQRRQYRQELYEPLRQIMNHARVQHQAIQDRIYNEYGIYRAYTNDPVYAQLSKEALHSISRNKQERDALNYALLVRNRTIEAMKRAWHIHCKPDSVVEKTLYALASRNISTPALLVEAINDVIKAQSQETRQEVVDALYAKNGVVKDFAQWESVKAVSLPSAISQPAYDIVRHKLNQLLCLEQQSLSANQTIAVRHAHTYLEHAFTTDDLELRSAYLCLYDHMVHIAQKNGNSLIITKPCLVAEFEHPRRALTQKCIVMTCASLAEVEKKLMQCGTSTIDAQTGISIEKEISRQLDVLYKAHVLNSAGSADQANKILAETFGNVRDGFLIVASHRPMVYGHNAVEKVCACIDGNPENNIIGCGTSVLEDVLSWGEINRVDVRNKIATIQAIQARIPIQFLQEQDSDSKLKPRPDSVPIGGVISDIDGEQKVEDESKADLDNEGGFPENDPEIDPLPVNNPSIMKHIFRIAAGHMADTPENRQALRDLVRDVTNYLGTDENGKRCYVKMLETGQQLWAEVVNGVIRNGGLNETPRLFNPETGLANAIRLTNSLKGN